MIFGLKYIENHGVYRLHDAIDHFILMGCDEAVFGAQCFPDWFKPVFNGCPKLRQLTKNVWTALRASADDLGKVRAIWHVLSDVETLCKDVSVSVSFDQPSAAAETVLRALFDYLYDDCLGVKCCRTTCGDIDEHYARFRKECATVCPFCGLDSYPDPGCGYRAAYDHYLCRSLYPLLAVCFRNLVPICESCNKAPQKADTDLLHSNGVRRQVYFPFGVVSGVRIDVTWFQRPSLGQNGVCRVTLTPVQAAEADQVATWITVYRISERASARIQAHYDTWMKAILRHKGFAVKPTVAELRDLFREEAQALMVEMTLRQETDALYKHGVYAYLAEAAPDTELEGIASIATSKAILTPVAIG